jgi:hypothetical protein
MNKLAYEIDSWDLQVALESGEDFTVIDAALRARTRKVA